jgi:hypothetical protein
MNRKRIVWIVTVAVIVGLLGGALALAKPAPPPPQPPINCKFVLCAYPDCLPNEHTEIPPGGCCPVCVPN